MEKKNGLQKEKALGVHNRNVYIDYMKFIAAFLVVAIHVSPLSGINENGDFILTRIIARIAVPFFFMVSGYFVLPGSKKHNGRILKFLKKTSLLYLAAIILYLPINFYTGYFKELKIGTVLRDIFFDGTFYHLWYLPAVILGILICLFLIRIAGEKAAFAVTVILYLAGLLGDSYYGLTRLSPVMAEIYDGVLQVFSYTRNGIFFAPVFLMLGCLIKNGEKTETKETKRNNTNGVIYGLTVLIFFLPMLAEGLLLHKYGWQRHDSMYILLAPLMYFFFIWILSLSDQEKYLEEKNGKAAESAEKFRDETNGGKMKSGRAGREERSGDMGNMAMIIYLIHPLVLILLRGISKPLKLYGILVENSLICYFAVSLLSALGAWILLLIYKAFSGRSPKTKRRGSHKEVLQRRENQERESIQSGHVPKEALAQSESVPGLERDRAWLEINLENLKWNVEQIKRLLPEDCKFMAVVKANAYGHGSLEVAQFLYKTGIRAFAVATLLEGIYLRENGIKGKILVLGYTHPSNASYLAKYRLIQTVVDAEYAESLNEWGIPLKVHIGVDTGMHRLGEDYRNREKIAAIFDCKNLEVEGIYSHLCVSDGREEWAGAYTGKQIERFFGVVDFLQERGWEELKIHLQSSYGAANYPKLPVSYARIGIMMYGCLSGWGDETKQTLDLKAVLTLKARVALTKKLKKGECVGYGCTFKAPCDMMIATVTVGYGDGYPRSLSGGKQSLLIHGKRAKIIGRICMDSLTVDITGIEEVKTGDEAVLIGRDGDMQINAEEVANAAGTITNELLCRLGSRLGHVVT